MWWFHFAVQFLCAGEAAPLPHLNQQQNEGQLRVGGEPEWEGRHFGADMSKTERAAEAEEITSWGLWRSALTCEWDWKNVIHGKQRQVQLWESLCLSWKILHVLRAEVTQVFPSHPYSNTCYLCFDLQHGWNSKNVHPPASVFSSPVPPPPHARGGCQLQTLLLKQLQHWLSQ